MHLELPHSFSILLVFLFARAREGRHAYYRILITHRHHSHHHDFIARKSRHGQNGCSQHDDMHTGYRGRDQGASPPSRHRSFFDRRRVQDESCRAHHDKIDRACQDRHDDSNTATRRKGKDRAGDARHQCHHQVSDRRREALAPAARCAGKTDRGGTATGHRKTHPSTVAFGAVSLFRVRPM